MMVTILKGGTISVVLIFAMLMSTLAFAKKPAWAGHGSEKNQQHKKNNQRNDDIDVGSNRDESTVHVHAHFNDRDRVIIHDYYEERYSSGRCPPGLAKKRNGCLPPGQAKKWRRGYPLSREVIYYDLPASIIVKIGLPPANHQYVRVAQDILLIALGTGIVVDAIEDLGRIQLR